MTLMHRFLGVCDTTRDILAPSHLDDFMIGNDRLSRTARAVSLLFIGSGVLMFPLVALSAALPKTALFLGSVLLSGTFALTIGMLARKTWFFKPLAPVAISSAPSTTPSDANLCDLDRIDAITVDFRSCADRQKKLENQFRLLMASPSGNRSFLPADNLFRIGFSGEVNPRDPSFEIWFSESSYPGLTAVCCDCFRSDQFKLNGQKLTKDAVGRVNVVNFQVGKNEIFCSGKPFLTIYIPKKNS